MEEFKVYFNNLKPTFTFDMNWSAEYNNILDITVHTAHNCQPTLYTKATDRNTCCWLQAVFIQGISNMVCLFAGFTDWKSFVPLVLRQGQKNLKTSFQQGVGIDCVYNKVWERSREYIMQAVSRLSQIKIIHVYLLVVFTFVRSNQIHNIEALAYFAL